MYRYPRGCDEGYIRNGDANATVSRISSPRSAVDASPIISAFCQLRALKHPLRKPSACGGVLPHSRHRRRRV
ncbi:hypothetical protein C8035_v004383 [Colletotrichum spinosum]|uniref:Uncharacterized protein n=1 Tax=Colletotrichum spinosum TaxID=1347390 RepID=A0A4R8PM83_9PEZI|nr:hypothetical protein C8035_v004383 [Colletotrichum spinosum]